MSSGASVMVGTNPIVELDKTFFLLRPLVEYLHDYSLMTLDQVRIGGDMPTYGTYWLSTRDLDLTSAWLEEWENYIFELSSTGVQLQEGKD